jgi:signal peptidase I
VLLHMNKKVLTTIMNIALTIFLVLVAAVIVLKVFFINSRIVVSDSMAPTLKEGDQLICWKLSLSGKNDHSEAAIRVVLKAKDIIVLKLDTEADYLIKRIIGLPGDTVEIKTNGVFVDGKKLYEEYLSQEWVILDYSKYIIPENGVFVLGDQRGRSRDSRVFGVVHADEIKEKVLFRFSPPERIGMIR